MAPATAPVATTTSAATATSTPFSRRTSIVATLEIPTPFFSWCTQTITGLTRVEAGYVAALRVGLRGGFTTTTYAFCPPVPNSRRSGSPEDAGKVTLTSRKLRMARGAHCRFCFLPSEPKYGHLLLRVSPFFQEERRGAPMTRPHLARHLCHLARNLFMPRGQIHAFL